MTAGTKWGAPVTGVLMLVGAWLLANMFTNAPEWAALSVVAALGAFAWRYRGGSSAGRTWPTVVVLVCALAVGTVVVALGGWMLGTLPGGPPVLRPPDPSYTTEARHRVQMVHEGEEWTLIELLDVDLANLVEESAEQPHPVEQWIERLQGGSSGWKVSSLEQDSVQLRHERRPITARVAWWRTHAVQEISVSLPTLPLTDDGFLELEAAEDSHVRLVSPRWMVVDTYPRATDEGIRGSAGQEVRRIPLTALYEDQEYGGEISSVTVTLAGPLFRHGPGSRGVSVLRTDGWAALLAVGVPVLLVRRLAKVVDGVLDEASKGWLKRHWRRLRGKRHPPPVRSEESDTPPVEPPVPEEPPGSGPGASPSTT